VTTARKKPLRRLLNALFQAERLRELRAQQWKPEERRRLETAKSAMLVSWRILAGLEPVPYSARGAVALPLLSSGLKTCLEVVSPHASSFVDLFDDVEWQERFTRSGLSSEQQTNVHQWLLEADAHSSDLTLARSALTVLRTALESTQTVDRAVRRIRWRRALVWVALGLLIVAVVAATTVAGKPNGPPDLAAGKPWMASSNYPGFSSVGSKPVRPIEGLFFSTNEENEPWWRVDLEQVVALGSVEVVNRSDCCADRAFPLVLELSQDGKKWHEVARQNEPFSTWDAKFPTRRGRYVRLRSLKHTLLHFRDVRVHAAR
jgi:hypothetical protein